MEMDEVRFNFIFSFNKLANELTLDTELLIKLWLSNSFAIISLSFKRNADNVAIDSWRFVRKNDLFLERKQSYFIHLPF